MANRSDYRDDRGEDGWVRYYNPLRHVSEWDRRPHAQRGDQNYGFERPTDPTYDLYYNRPYYISGNEIDRRSRSSRYRSDPRQLPLSKSRQQTGIFFALAITSVVGILILCALVIVPVLYAVGHVKMDGSLTMMQTFLPEYNDKMSDEYKALENNFIAAMDDIFQSSSLRNAYEGTVVNGFSPGSVRVVFILLFAANIVDLVPPQGPGQTINSVAEVEVHSIIVLAVGNGACCQGLGIVPNSVEIENVKVATTTDSPQTTTTPDVVTKTAPEVTTTAPSDVTTTTAPDVTTTAAPDVVTTTAPDVVTTTAPDVVTTTAPDVKTTTAPDVVTSTVPDVVTTTAADVKTTTAPDVTSTTTPDVVTTTAPDVVTTTAPDVTTTTGICGTVPLRSNVDPRIVNGNDADEGEWPWTVAVVDSENKQWCGGSLINSQWAVTAAHCAGVINSTFAGVRDLSNTGGNSVHVAVSEVIVHESYGASNTKSHDIALMKFERPVNFTDYIRPICLNADQNETGVYTECYATGWGAIEENGTAANILQEVRLPLIDLEDCQGMYAMDQIVIDESMICAGFEEGGKDSCEGDSGGPLVCETGDGRWTLVGATSFGIGCARPGYPGVYARISQHLDFIESHVNTDPSPDPGN